MFSSNTSLDSSVGTVVFTTPGTYSWIVPYEVTSISIACIAGGGAGSNNSPAASSVRGGSGAGGAAAYANSVSVTPGETLTVVVGDGGAGTNDVGNTGGESKVTRSTTNLVRVTGGEGGRNPGGGSERESNGGTVAVGTGGSGGNGSAPANIGGSVYAGGAGSFSGGNQGNDTGASLISGSGPYGAGTTGAPSYVSYGSTYPSNLLNGNPGGVRIIWGSGRSYPSNAT